MNTTKEEISKTGAFDKVNDYLRSHLKVGERSESFRLPPIRELSRRTGVSPSSVRNVLVGLSERGLVEIYPGSGAFWIPEDLRKKTGLVLGVNSGQNQVSGNTKLFGGMVQGAVQAGMEIKFKPFVYEPAYPERLDYTLLEKSVEGIDACFLSFPFAETEKVAEFLEKLAIPCFFYNPLTLKKTSNFLSPDYFEAARQIGLAWSRTGRKRIMLLQAPGIQKSTSCQLLYSGITTGLGLEREILPEIYRVSVEANQRRYGYQAFREFVAHTGKTPDAVHCTADDLAMGVLDAARELNIKVPSAMSVIGGNGTSRLHHAENAPLLTATENPVEQIGLNFISLFQKRSANQMRDVPGMYFPMRFLIGHTTRPEENELLSADMDGHLLTKAAT